MMKKRFDNYLYPRLADDISFNGAEYFVQQLKEACQLIVEDPECGPVEDQEVRDLIQVLKDFQKKKWPK